VHEVRARREYLDLLPVLRRYRKARTVAMTDADLIEKKLASIASCLTRRGA